MAVKIGRPITIREEGTSRDMKQNIFSPMEIDAIGEIMNISLGSSATAVSNMLDHRVDITTPSVSVVPIEEFTLGELEPAIGIEIKYVSGLEGATSCFSSATTSRRS